MELWPPPVCHLEMDGFYIDRSIGSYERPNLHKGSGA